MYPVCEVGRGGGGVRVGTSEITLSCVFAPDVQPLVFCVQYRQSEAPLIAVVPNMISPA